MDHVYLLHHVHAVSEDHEDVKLLGVFSSLDAAERARVRALNLQGFKDTPEGFSIDKYMIDQMKWTTGYRTI